MTAAVLDSCGIQLREATALDNAALITLTAACTMNGDIALRVDRAPDFFALNRLEGDACRVGVVTGDGGRILGCVAAARREVYVNGAMEVISYVSDLKVHPDARRAGVADLLTDYVRDAASGIGGAEVRCVLTILAGNAPMEHRARGPRGAPVLSRFATLSVKAIPLLWNRPERVNGIRVRSARTGDLPAMADAWHRHAICRQLATCFDAGQLSTWIARAPGLGVSDYLLAFDDAGRLRGFIGVWDQATFKQMRVVSYSPRLALTRRALNLIAPFAGTVPLPSPGGALPALATVHVCADQPHILRALLLEAYRRFRGGCHAFITVGLDERDPLGTAMDGLFAQPTRVHAYVTTPTGIADPEPLARLPLHLETALV